MRLTRRAFLQQFSLAIATLGMSQGGFLPLVDRYQSALAQPTRRKLALLVGINQYPESVCDFALPKSSALSGCLTDVELQQQLLIHRFGFQPTDILTLTDQQATRDRIETAFQNHLIDQARSGDVVVFHFSGLGSQVHSSNDPATIWNSLVPVDGILPTEEAPIIRDLMAETLNLLVRSLQTHQVVTLLDLGYTHSGNLLKGNLRVRSRPTAPTGLLDPEELALQEQLLGQLRGNPTLLKSTPSAGVMLTAAHPNQPAFEKTWSGFSAGLFTYALTRHLWETNDATTLRFVFNQTAADLQSIAGEEQQPQLLVQKGQNQDASPLLNVPGQQPVDGVITAVEADGSAVQVWMGGLPASVLEYLSPHSLLTLTGSSGSLDEQTGEPVPALLQVRSRDGLRISAVPVGGNPSLRMGQSVQEWVRVIPTNVGLTIALDASLERIERVDATSAFAAAKVALATVGEHSADYLFGKLQPEATTLSASAAADGVPSGLPQTSEKGSYGLFYPSRRAIPGTLAETEEAVKTAVNRLTPRLRSLLAKKWLRLTVNSASSRLAVEATLEQLTSPPQAIAHQQTGVISAKTALTYQGEISTIPAGSALRLRLNNRSDRPLYWALLHWDEMGGAIALSPFVSATADVTGEPNNEPQIPPGSSLTLPPTDTGSSWKSSNTPGLTELYAVFSHTPLTQFHQVLQKQAGSPTATDYPLTNPLEAIQGLLQDLNQSNLAYGLDIPADAYALDINHWATLKLVYRSV